MSKNKRNNVEINIYGGNIQVMPNVREVEQHIHTKARENMTMIPPEQLDCIKEFDIFVVRSNAPSAQDATAESGQLLALGHYDGEKVEMAMFDDIKHNLKNEE